MASVYASLLSLIKVINRTQNPPLPYAYLIKLQTQPLLDRVTFLLELVEYFSEHTKISKKIDEIEFLECRITAANNIAEDIIELFVMFQIERKRERAKSSTSVNDRYVISSKNLEKVVQEMDLIKEEMLKIQVYYKEKNNKQQLTKHSIEPALSSLSINAMARPPPSGGKNNNTRMMGFDDDLLKLKEKLDAGQLGRLVLPVVGMGGTGKTTLATNAYDDPFIRSCFHIRAWATISHVYSLRNIFLCLMYDTGLFKLIHKNLDAFSKDMHDMSDAELGQKLYQTLFGRKYLIILDDLWSITAWDEMNRFFPDNGNGSRILVTTRLSNLAHILRSSLNSYHEMKFLDDDVSWSLLLDKVFDGGKQICPPELEEIGRIIAKKCSGLPLAIVVMGGLLKMSDKTLERWNEVVEKVSSIVNIQNDEQCLRILSISYDQLPIQLKPLFLYMAIFPEDEEVKVSTLIKLWIAEGFIKLPPPDKISTTLEDIARILLRDLVDRNLIMVHKRNRRGNIKTCKIHDLLRDFSLRKVKKERFLCTEMMCDFDEGNEWDRRFFSLYSNGNIWDNKFSFDRMVMENSEIQPVSSISHLLRVFHVNGNQMLTLQFVLNFSNSRYIAFSVKEITSQELLLLPWNPETLHVAIYHKADITLPSVIWEMQHLRHLKFRNGVKLCMPNSEINHYCILYDLQTLSRIWNFEFTDEILRRIPNLKKLGIAYDDRLIEKDDEEGEEKVVHINQNLVLLQKLEIFSCYYYFSNKYRLKIQLNFPPSLKMLTLHGSRIPWEHINIVGSLPKLEVLFLYLNSFCGRKWISTDQFQCLKSLSISRSDIEIWEADSNSFPALEYLALRYCRKLEEIPWGIGEIPSLKSIELHYCKRSAIISAKEILLEVEEQGINDDLRVLVIIENEDAELQSFASPNFKVWVSPLSEDNIRDNDIIETNYMGDSFQPSIFEHFNG